MLHSEPMNRQLQKGGQLFAFFNLYIMQKIPMAFFSTVIPVIMRQHNFSLEVIGMLQFLKLPWILKFLWSPSIDRSCKKVSDYKCWIFTSEIIYALIIFSIAFLDLKVTPFLVIGLIIMAFVASATQDIATDALAVISFSNKDKSLVNSMQSIGGFAGAMIGGGGLLLIYNKMGWHNLLPFLALFVLLAIVPLFFFKGGTTADQNLLAKHSMAKPSLNDLSGFFKQRGIWKQIVFLFIYYAGLIGTLSMFKPMLVDLGYSIKQIGVMSGVIGTSIGCLGSLSGGFIVRKIGRFKSRILFAFFVLLSALYFVLLLTCMPINIATLHLGISLLWFSYGSATIVVYTTAMDCVRKGYEGTDFTIQTVITHLSGMLMAVGAGKLAGIYSYKILFYVEMFIALASFIYILIIFKNVKNQ